MTFGSVGSTLTPSIRPATGWLPGVWPLSTGAGPCGNQVATLPMFLALGEPVFRVWSDLPATVMLPCNSMPETPDVMTPPLPGVTVVGGIATADPDAVIVGTLKPVRFPPKETV